MATVHESTGWKGLIGCLGIGIAVVAAIVFAVMFFRSRHENTRTRIDSEFLQPWFRAAREDAMETAWTTLTTESYRKTRPQADVAATYAAATRLFGKPVAASIHGQQGEKVPGQSWHQRTATQWTWENGTTLHLVFNLVDVPGQGYRVESAGLGTLTKSQTGYHPPQGTPDGPW